MSGRLPFIKIVGAQLPRLVYLMLSLWLTLSYYPSAWAKSPSDYLVVAGYRQLTQAQYEQAVDTLVQAVRVDPSNPAARRYLCSALLRTGRTQDAVQQLDLLVRLFPASAVDRASLGEAYFYEGKYTAAATHYQLAIKLDPHLMTARNGLADTYLALGQPDKAVQACIQGAQSASDLLTRQRFVARARQIQDKQGEQRPRMDG